MDKPTTVQTIEDIRGSDHLPILIQAFCRTQRQRWKPNHDLSEFRATLEHKMEDVKLQVDTLERAKQFTALVIETATATVPRTKPGKKTRRYITSEIKQLISKRNRLRCNLHLETCRDVREKVAAARKNQWVEFIKEVEYGTDPWKLWSVLHSLGDSTTPSQPNEAQKLGDKTINSSLKKADAFMQHYAKESRLQFSKSERDTNRTSRRLKSAMFAYDASGQDFTMLELEKALASMQSRGAAGPDEITPAFIKALGHNAKCALLALYNDSWNHAAVPQGWRNATIIPLLKAGKDPASIASFRPISLTSCLAKVLERSIASRLVNLIETRGLLSNN